MNDIRYYPVVDTVREKGKLLEQYVSVNDQLFHTLEKANIILVGGGDGFMLDTIKNYSEEEKLFLGVNCGTLGFLLNDISDFSQLPSHLEELDIVELDLMKVSVLKTDGSQEEMYALNDVVLGGNILDYFTFDVQHQDFEKQIKGTGLIVANSSGTTAYWLGNGGPLVPLQSDLWGVMGIASRPFHHKLIQPSELKISVKGRTPALIGVDGYGGKVDDVKEVLISPSDKKVRLAFLKTKSFDHKRVLLSDEKLGGS